MVIVDGAAFGSEMKEVMEYVNVFENVVLYAPESFEWLLLVSNVISDKEITDILEKPENYIESKEYVSWERFFTEVLINKTQKNSVWAYSKRKLPKVYLSSKVVNAVQKVMKKINWKGRK